MSLLRKRLNESGFTLLELLIVMGISSFLLLATFDLLDTNYQTVGNEMDKNESRDNLKIFSSYMIQDLMYSEKVEIYHAGTLDMLHYQGKNGSEVVIKFDHKEGIFEVKGAEELLIATGEKIYTELPMVREEDGMIVFNFYATGINAAMDLSIRPRKSE